MLCFQWSCVANYTVTWLTSLEEDKQSFMVAPSVSIDISIRLLKAQLIALVLSFFPYLQRVQFSFDVF